MSLMFYPHSDDIQKGTLPERIEILMEAAERYRAIIQDDARHLGEQKQIEAENRGMVPRDMTAAYNWPEIANILREVREYPEGERLDRAQKADLFIKLAEVYEVLRAAKMPKLEAVRLALISEANQLKGNAKTL